MNEWCRRMHRLHEPADLTTVSGKHTCVWCKEEVVLEQPATQMAGDRDGETFDPVPDRARLNAQHLRVYEVMRDGAWWSLAEISAKTDDPEASISARLRDFRKPKFGGHTVERRRFFFAMGPPRGHWQYRLIWNEDIPRP